MSTNGSQFTVFKEADGKPYWIAKFTNTSEDRDGEVLSTKAHEGYVSRVQSGAIKPPELWAYHTKGTKHGQADKVWMQNGAVWARGHFDDTPLAQRAIKAYESHNGKIELSHGFTYPKGALKNGVYESYNTFEISTLPEGAAANPFTSFETFTAAKSVDSKAMKSPTNKLTEKARKWILSLFGEEGLHEAELAAGNKTYDPDVRAAYKVKPTENPHTVAFKLFLGVVSDARREGVKFTSDDLLAGYKKAMQIVDDSAALPGATTPQQVAATTTIIEDPIERMANYVKLLGMSKRLDFFTRKLIGEDLTEDVYREALVYLNNPHLMGKAHRKAFDNTELSQLEDQQLAAIGIPEAVALALGTVLQSKFNQFVKDIQTSLFWGAIAKGTN